MRTAGADGPGVMAPAGGWSAWVWRIALGLAALALAAAPATAASAASDPVSLVNPLVGTEGQGHTFPGADVPFGMVQFSPVTVAGGPGG